MKNQQSIVQEILNRLEKEGLTESESLSVLYDARSVIWHKMKQSYVTNLTGLDGNNSIPRLNRMQLWFGEKYLGIPVALLMIGTIIYYLIW